MSADLSAEGPLEIHRRHGEPVTPSTPIVVFVHGAADRGAAFARVGRELPDMDVVRFDRRGYGRSLDKGVRRVRSGAEVLADAVGDLIVVIGSARAAAVVNGGAPLIVAGHSMGALIALATAVEYPELVSGVVAWEPPMPWESWWRPSGTTQRSSSVTPVPDGAPGGDERRRRGAAAMESFLRQRLGDAHWESLPAGIRRTREAEGLALVDDMEAARAAEAIEFGAVSVPVVLGVGTATEARHVRAVTAMTSLITGANVVSAPGADHGAHITHPGVVAAAVRECVGSIRP